MRPQQIVIIVVIQQKVQQRVVAYNLCYAKTNLYYFTMKTHQQGLDLHFSFFHVVTSNVTSWLEILLLHQSFQQFVCPSVLMS